MRVKVRVRRRCSPAPPADAASPPLACTLVLSKRRARTAWRPGRAPMGRAPQAVDRCRRPKRSGIRGLARSGRRLRPWTGSPAGNNRDRDEPVSPRRRQEFRHPRVASAADQPPDSPHGTGTCQKLLRIRCVGISYAPADRQVLVLPRSEAFFVLLVAISVSEFLTPGRRPRPGPLSYQSVAGNKCADTAFRRTAAARPVPAPSRTAGFSRSIIDGMEPAAPLRPQMASWEPAQAG